MYRYWSVNWCGHEGNQPKTIERSDVLTVVAECSDICTEKNTTWRTFFTGYVIIVQWNGQLNLFVLTLTLFPSVLSSPSSSSSLSSSSPIPLFIARSNGERERERESLIAGGQLTFLVTSLDRAKWTNRHSSVDAVLLPFSSSSLLCC